MGTTAARGPALAGTGLGNDRPFIRLGIAAAVCGMLAWIIGVALIPPDAKVEQGSQHLARVLQAHAAPLYAAALLAVAGGTLLATPGQGDLCERDQLSQESPATQGLRWPCHRVFVCRWCCLA